MYILQFWKSWPPVYQRLWWIVLITFTASVGILVFSFAKHPAPVFAWEQFQDLKRQEIPVYNIEVGGINIPVLTENYILFERWAGKPMQIDLSALDIYLFLFAAAMVMILAIISALPRFWFLVGAGAAVFMISSFQLETLEIFGLYNKIPTIGIMIILIGTALYFQFLNKSASLLYRIGGFLIATIITGLIISNFSTAQHPLRYLAVNTLSSSLVITILFIVLVAHEIMASFVSLVGKGTQNSKTLRHYVIISLFYLVNLWFTYLDRINYIEWAFTIPPVLLLVISGILALWGIRQREPVYENILTADPFAVYLIGSLAVLSFGTLGYFIASANDLVVLSLSDLILYAHIGYGMIFFLYVISNFMPMLIANYKVSRVLYKPTAMPYISYRLAGLIFTLAFVFYNNWMAPVNHFISGYYTSLGDLFTQQDETLSTGYYKRAYFYAPYNQHAATALAKNEALKSNTLNQRKYLNGANSYRPTEFTLLNNAATFSGNSLEELIVLQEAYKLQPKSGAIKNNLAISFSKLGMTDSASHYFEEAQKNNLTRPSAEMNFFGLMASYDTKVNADSLYKASESEPPKIKSNIIAIANHQGKVMDIKMDLPKDSTLNLFTATMIGNYITNHIGIIDTAFVASSAAVARKKQNKDYSELVLIPAARAYYAAGLVNRAFELLQEVMSTSSNPGIHNITMALWSLDHDKPDLASAFLHYAMYTSPQTSLVNAVTITEVGRINEAIIAWDTLHYKKDTVIRSIAESMKRVLAGDASWYQGFSDKEKYQYLRHRVSIYDSISFNSLVNQIINEDLKAKAILDRSKKWFSLDEVSKAAYTYKRLQGLHLTDIELFAKIKYYELRMFAAQNYWQLIDEQIKKGVSFGAYRETERVYYEALRNLNTNDTLSASKNFNWLAKNNYMFDEGVVAASDFFKRSSKRRSYTILSEALQVNPNSVKILKAYIPIAQANEYDDYAASALQTLKGLISPAAFQKFVSRNQLSSLVIQ